MLDLASLNCYPRGRSLSLSTFLAFHAAKCATVTRMAAFQATMTIHHGRSTKSMPLRLLVVATQVALFMVTYVVACCLVFLLSDLM